MKEYELPKWNVYMGDFNSGYIKEFNIFRHVSFLDDVCKTVKKYRQILKKEGTFDRAAFAEELRHQLMYYFWCKCEYEIILDHWPPSDRTNARKVDIYEQVLLNFDVFTDYVWGHREELLKCRKK